MSGTDVPKRQYYARRAKTANAKYWLCDCDRDVGPKRRRLGPRRRPLVADSKILHIDNRDRLSILPQDLIHCIMNRLPVHDAARTSILSKEWRYVWGTNTRLVLDELFFSQLTLHKDIGEHQAAFIRAVEMIMLVHIGPLLNFSLYIPPKLSQFPVSKWIEHILKKGVRDIDLTNSEKNAYEIPSCLFNCPQLTHLKLDAWIFNPSCKFTTVTNLTWVKLINISFNADISFGTRLKYLSFEYCSGIEHVASQFTNGNSLTMLRFTASEQIDWRWLECTKQLKYLGLELDPVASFNMKNSIKLFKLLGSIPSLYGLYTSAFTLEVLGTELTVKGPATKFANLGTLMFSQLGPCDLRQISNSICLIRCLPNLQSLYILLEVEVKKAAPVELTSNLDSVDWKNMSLGRLCRVNIQGVVCSKYLI